MSHALLILKMWVIFQLDRPGLVCLVWFIFTSGFSVDILSKNLCLYFWKSSKIKAFLLYFSFCCVRPFWASKAFLCANTNEVLEQLLLRNITFWRTWNSVDVWPCSHPTSSCSRISSSLAHQSRPTDLRALLVGAPRILAPTSTRPPPDYYHYLLPQLPPIPADHTASRLPLTVDYYHASTNTDRSPPKLPPRDHHQHQRISSTIRLPPPIPECKQPLSVIELPKTTNMLANSLGLPALKSKSAKDRQTYKVAWLEQRHLHL